jgi:hypothetical protein
MMETKNASPQRQPPWWQHRAFRSFAKLLLFLALPVFAFYTIDRILGDRAWKAYKRRAEAKGVKLRIEDYVPPAVSDDENYAFAPIFRNMFAGQNEAMKVEKLFTLPYPPNRKPYEAEAKPFDLTEWQKSFIKAGWLQSAGSDPAADVLAALKRVEGSLSQIRAASTRPKSRWPVQWNEGPGARPYHYQTLKAVSQCLALRARALLALDRPDEALEELRHIFRIDQSISNEPTLLPALVRNSLWAQVLNVCEQGFAANKWKTAHLQSIAKEIESLNFLGIWKEALNSERGIGNHIYNLLATATKTELTNAMQGVSSAETASIIWYAIPRGWVRFNQVQYNELLDLDLGDIDSANELVDPRFSRAKAIVDERSSGPVWGRLYTFFADTMVGVTEGGGNRAFEMHSRLRQFRILCAIASFREAHGEAPESLNALVPKYLTAIPHDIMDGKPMRYRRNEDGGCAIWSIGGNRIDDNGTRGEFRSRHQAKDWVLEMPPVP